MFSRLGVMLVLVVKLKMDCALPIGDQIVNDVSHYPISEGLDKFLALPQRPKSFSSPFDSSLKEQSFGAPTGNVLDASFMNTQPTQQEDPETWLRDWTATSPSMHVTHISEGHRLEQPHNVIGTMDASLFSVSGYDPFDLDWIYELDIPKFIEKDPEFINLETEELWNHAQWQPLPAYAQPGSTSPVAQTVENPIHNFSAATFQSTRDTIRSPVTSDSHSPTTSGKFPSPVGDLEEQRQSNDDQELLQCEQFALQPHIRLFDCSPTNGPKQVSQSPTGSLSDNLGLLGGQNLKNLPREVDDVIIENPYAFEAHHQSDRPVAESSAPGPSPDVTGINQLADNRAYIPYQPKRSKKRKFHGLAHVRKIPTRKKNSISDWRTKVLEYCKKNLENAKKELEAYARELRPREHQSTELQSKGKFRVGQQLKDLLTPNPTMEGQLALMNFVGSYRSCFIPLEQYQIAKVTSRGRVDKNFIAFAKKKMVSSISYLIGRKKLMSTDWNLGETITELESKWLDHLLKRYSEVCHWGRIRSFYECIIISTTSLLYQIDLVYRLIIPFNEGMKPEKDNSINKALLDLDYLWMNFPLGGEAWISPPDESNDFFSENLVKDIEGAKKNPGSIPAQIRVTRMLFIQWFLKKNFLFYHHIKSTSKSNAGSAFFDIIHDCAWLEYLEMREAEQPHLSPELTSSPPAD